MNKIYILPEDDLRGEIYRRIFLLVNKERGGWQSFGAAFGLICGTLAAPLALLLWAAAVAFIAPIGIRPALQVLSNILFAATLPLLALGAYCLDLLEKKHHVIHLAGTQLISPARRRHIRPLRPHHK